MITLTLLRWIMSENNPLAARVIANRQWEALCGTGLVTTSEEFGSGENIHPILDFSTGWQLN